MTEDIGYLYLCLMGYFRPFIMPELGNFFRKYHRPNSYNSFNNDHDIYTN